MERKLLRPFDDQCPEFDTQSERRLKERWEFGDPTGWVIYQAKVYYEALGRLDEATRLLEHAFSQSPHEVDIILCLAECYSRDPRRHAEALELCRSGLALNPSSDYGYTIKARVEFEQGKAVDAYVSAMAALKINSRNYEAGVYLGIIGFAMAEAERDVNEMELSIENLRVTQSLNPGSSYLRRVITENEQRLREIRTNS